jgi:hypothetical protein
MPLSQTRVQRNGEMSWRAGGGLAGQRGEMVSSLMSLKDSGPRPTLTPHAGGGYLICQSQNIFNHINTGTSIPIFTCSGT